MSEIAESTPNASQPCRRTTSLLKHILGFGVSFLLLAWLLRKADLRGVWHAIEKISFWPVLLTLRSPPHLPLRTYQLQWLWRRDEARFQQCSVRFHLAISATSFCPCEAASF